MDLQKNKKIDVRNVNKVLMGQVQRNKSNTSQKKGAGASTIDLYSNVSNSLQNKASIEQAEARNGPLSSYNNHGTTSFRYPGGTINSTLYSHQSSFNLSPSQKALLKQQMLGLDASKAQQLRVHHREQERKLEEKRSNAVEKLHKYKEMYKEVRKQGGNTSNGK